MEEFNALSDTIEGVVIGNECMKLDESISFSRFQSIKVIAIGFNSLRKLSTLDLSSNLIAD